MSLWERLQNEKEIKELERRNQIESAKLKAFQKVQRSRLQNLNCCPYCGKQLP